MAGILRRIGSDTPLSRKRNRLLCFTAHGPFPIATSLRLSLITTHKNSKTHGVIQSSAFTLKSLKETPGNFPTCLCLQAQAVGLFSFSVLTPIELHERLKMTGLPPSSDRVCATLSEVGVSLSSLSWSDITRAFLPHVLYFDPL